MAKNNCINNYVDLLSVTNTIIAQSNVVCTTGNMIGLNSNCYINGVGGVGDLIANNDALDSTSCSFFIRKERSGATVLNNDGLGLLANRGFDGASFQESTRIFSSAQTTIAAGKIPGAIFFQTKSDTATALRSQCNISKDGTFSNVAPISGTALTTNGAISINGSVRCATLRVSGDSGGAASTIALTNVVDTSANGAGTFTVKSKSATDLDSSGFVKVYIGATEYYIPAFTSVAP